jgi:hypothetical protein
MDFSAREFTNQEKIELLQRWVLVHSYLYYIMDVSVVSDYRYDMNTKQLYGLKVDYPEDWSRARYTYAMHDFDGSTGFGFVERLDEKELRSVLFDVVLLTSQHS